jgi:CRP/FNR family transcriptional regulator
MLGPLRWVRPVATIIRWFNFNGGIMFMCRCEMAIRVAIEMLRAELRMMISNTKNADSATSCGSCSVRAVSFCSAVPHRDLGVLARSRHQVQFRRRETIVREGDPAVSFFNVTTGIVKLYRSLSDGRTQILGFRFPGELFAIAETSRYGTTAEAVTDVETCRYSRARLKRLTSSFPQLQAKLLQMSYREQVASEDHIFLLGRKTAREKIATFLLRYSRESCQSIDGKGRHVNLPMTRTEVADFLGLTTETVSRVLTSLARENIITVGVSRSVGFIDIDSLTRISGT